jgi:hypothetical protein
MINKVTVFCGSSAGTDYVYRQTAEALGKFLVAQHIELVYGGAKVGLMGHLADAVLDNGGRVSGVLPLFLGSKEIAHEGLSQLILVNSMHERKLKMYELSDAIIALPGGLGTMDELFEILTWAQLGLHQKPVGLLNVNGFYDDLVTMIEKMVEKGFVSEKNLELLLISDEMEDLFGQMKNYIPPVLPRIIAKETT